ncbi:hypothetical protein N9230_06645, partial [Akkermansiaceae bacterium]|nr:hypothetical protein [Akkermansiaceae bacterium]
MPSKPIALFDSMRSALLVFLLGSSSALAQETKLQPSPNFSTIPMLTDRSENSPLHDVFKKTDATEDPAWHSEILADNAKKQLKKIGEILFDEAA